MSNAIFNTSRNSDIDRRHIESLDEAESVLATYLDLDAGGRPHQVVAMDAMAIERAKHHVRLDHTNPDDVAMVFARLQGAIKELCVNEMTRLDRVHLDLTGDLGVPAWQSCTTPSMVFCRLRSQDSLYRQNVQVALAVYFDPTLVGRRAANGRFGPYEKPNVYDAAGYVAIARAFGSVDEAVSAREELEQACRVIRRPSTDSALEDDEVRMAGLDDIEIPYGLDLDAV